MCDMKSAKWGSGCIQMHRGVKKCRHAVPARVGLGPGLPMCVLKEFIIQIKQIKRVSLRLKYMQQLINIIMYVSIRLIAWVYGMD